MNFYVFCDGKAFRFHTIFHFRLFTFFYFLEYDALTFINIQYSNREHILCQYK